MAAVVMILAVAGCGASSLMASLGASAEGGSHGVTVTTAGQETVSQVYNRWAQCMRQHGVQMADPTLDE